MANNQRKKKKSIHIEMSILGLLGLGLVIFIVLLWMFLLGIWAGQTILLPEGGATVSAADASGLPPEGELSRKSAAPPAPAMQAAPPIKPPIEAPIEPQIDTESPLGTTTTPTPDEGGSAQPAEPETEPSPSSPPVFSLQVAAFSEAERADKEAAVWQQRGAEAFTLQPEEGGDGLYRVCVGRFAELAEANREASRLEETENIKAFITLVPATRAGQP